MQRAAELGIKLRPEYVQDVIEGIKKENNIASDEDLRAQLRLEGMTLDELKRNIERSVLRRQVLSHDLESKVQATEADARAYYESHKDEYTVSAGVRLEEIVVVDEAAAREIAASARAGADFAELARSRSLSPTASAGGDVGRLTAADIAPDLAKAVAALPAGGVSDPLKTVAGWRVVKVVAKEDAKTRPFEEVRADILKTLNEERGEKAFAEYMEGLRKANQPGIKLMANEVPLQVNLPPAGTPSVTGAPKAGTPPGIAAPAAPAPAMPGAPVLPGIDPSELSTSGPARPERVAPPSAPSAAPTPAPSPTPQP